MSVGYGEFLGEVEMDQAVCLEMRAVSYCCKFMAPADQTRMACTLDRDLDVEGVMYPMTLSQAPIWRF
jgi:hypothetical protein